MPQAKVFPAPMRRYVFPARDGDMSCGSFPKDPIEQFPVAIDWRRRLPTGRTVSRVTGSAIDLADNSAAAILTGASAVVADGLSWLTVKANTGVVGHRYKIYFDAFDNLNSHYRQSLIMIVRSA